MAFAVPPFFFLTLTMKEQLKAVAEFHKAFKQKDGKWPQPLEKSEYVLRHALMKEENDEYLEACKKNSLVEIADALGDQLYILCGTILKHGMQDVILDVFNEIQASNMSKLGPDGQPIFREDGKILKGPEYFKPNLSKFINQPYEEKENEN
jgi:predicted HAD superfamily Cof-like phosphohydrolase